ncbi:mucin-19-like [Corticium candelabrum]|uniref:mucin-19-like n=1 Tax=Corticium candelabrum TaxID=121492 RepID=UPI002E252CAA|nr:mucin-19-like [Corticium candelabrum]
MGTLLACPCRQNFTCSHSKSTKYGYHRQKYYSCLCRYPDDAENCDKYKNDMERYKDDPGSVCQRTVDSNLLIGPCGYNNCGDDQCCLQIKCDEVKKSKVDVVSICSSIPQVGDPCDVGLKGSPLTCPCGQNLSCSNSKSKRHDTYGKYRDKFYSCLCRYPDNTKKCDKYKKEMDKKGNNLESVCMTAANLMPGQCGTSSCDVQQCCLRISCGIIERKPKIDTLSVCSKVPQEKDSCDPGFMGTSLTCPCGQNLTCRQSDNTKATYYREKYFRCLCRYPETSYKCDRYKENMEKNEIESPGSFCRLRPISRLNLCGSTGCRTGQCCVELACPKNQFAPDSVSFCLSAPGENERCDPKGTFLCQCANTLSCVQFRSTIDPYKPEKDYANCLCNNFESPEKCKYSSVLCRNGSPAHYQDAPRCQQVTIITPPFQATPPTSPATPTVTTNPSTITPTAQTLQVTTETIKATTTTPRTTTETPKATTETPKATTETPKATTETPMATTETPKTTTETPMATTETPKATTETPMATTETPMATTETPKATTETPMTTTETPMATTETPMATTETPKATVSRPTSREPPEIPGQTVTSAAPTTSRQVTSTETQKSTTNTPTATEISETSELPTLEPPFTGSGMMTSQTIIIIFPGNETPSPTDDDTVTPTLPS